MWNRLVGISLDLHIWTWLLWNNCGLYCIMEITVCLCLFSSGLMVLLLSRSKPRMVQPPALQACYENQPVCLGYDGNRCLPIYYQTTVADLRVLFSPQGCSMIVCYHICNCCKTIIGVVHVFHALWWYGWLWAKGQGCIRIAKDTATYKRPSLYFPGFFSICWGEKN